MDGKVLLVALGAALPANRKKLLVDYLLETIASIAAIDQSEISAVLPITDFGLDSLMALELKNRIGADLEFTASTVRLLQGPTVREIADEIAASLPLRAESAVEVRPERSADAFSLSYSQQAQWLAHKIMVDCVAFNAGFTVRATPPVSYDAFESAVIKLVDRHAAYGPYFSRTTKGVRCRKYLPRRRPTSR